MPIRDSSQKFEIRPASEADASLMAEIEGLVSSSGWPESRIREEIIQPVSRSWLALGEMPLGYLLMREVQHEWEIINLLVRSDCRKKGIGKALMEVALAAIKSAGGECIFLEVRSQNVPAQSLYKSLGFEQCGKRKGYYLDPVDDALIMRLDLPSGTGIGEKPE